MPTIHVRCPMCHLLSIRDVDDPSPYACPHDDCAELAAQHRAAQYSMGGIQAVAPFSPYPRPSWIYYLRFGDRIKIGTTVTRSPPHRAPSRRSTRPRTRLLRPRAATACRVRRVPRRRTARVVPQGHSTPRPHPGPPRRARASGRHHQGRSMIITDRLGAATHIDAEHAADPEAFGEVAARLTREIIETGEGIGAFIRPESVWVEKKPNMLPTDQFVVEAQWSPDPETGVELRGGPADGEVIHLRRENDGRPLPVLTVPVAASDKFGLTSTAEYSRTGIDSERDIWVYSYRTTA